MTCDCRHPECTDCHPRRADAPPETTFRNGRERDCDYAGHHPACGAAFGPCTCAALDAADDVSAPVRATYDASTDPVPTFVPGLWEGKAVPMRGEPVPITPLRDIAIHPPQCRCGCAPSAEALIYGSTARVTKDGRAVAHAAMLGEALVLLERARMLAERAGAEMVEEDIQTAARRALVAKREAEDASTEKVG